MRIMPSGNEKGKSLGERVEMVRVGQEFRNFKELAGEASFPPCLFFIYLLTTITEYFL